MLGDKFLTRSYSPILVFARLLRDPGAPSSSPFISRAVLLGHQVRRDDTCRAAVKPTTRISKRALNTRIQREISLRELQAASTLSSVIVDPGTGGVLSCVLETETTVRDQTQKQETENKSDQRVQ